MIDRRFKTTIGMAALLSGSIVVLSTCWAEEKQEAKPTSPVVEAADAALKHMREVYDAGRADCEDVYRWSRRLMRAEIEAGANDGMPVVRHVKRMRELHDRVAAINRVGGEGGGHFELTATAYYLAKAKSAP
jgi:hypothetical protein